MKICVLVCRLRFQLRTASQFATLSIRLRLMSAIHVGDYDSYLQIMLAIRICDSVLLSFFCINIINTLWVNSADNKLIFFLIFPKIGVTISFRLSPGRTLCLKCQTIYWKNKKNISKCHLLNFFSRVLSINLFVVVV